MYVGDSDRERVAVALREHYARGRITLDEYTSRIQLVLGARSRDDLRRALAGLAVFPELSDLVRQGRGAARAALRGVALVVFTGAYLVFTFTLLLVLALVMLVHGVSDATLVGFLVVWLVPTYLLTRLWRGTQPRRRPRL
jgi:hypothetical protein